MWGGGEDDRGDFSRHYTFVFYEGWKVSGNLLVQPVGEHGDGLKRARKQQRRKSIFRLIKKYSTLLLSQ